MEKTPETVAIEVQLDGAWELAQFLKRITFEGIRACAANQAEAYLMRGALAQLASELAQKGISPR